MKGTGSGRLRLQCAACPQKPRAPGKVAALVRAWRVHGLWQWRMGALEGSPMVSVVSPAAPAHPPASPGRQRQPNSRTRHPNALPRSNWPSQSPRAQKVPSQQGQTLKQDPPGGGPVGCRLAPLPGCPGKSPPLRWLAAQVALEDHLEASVVEHRDAKLVVLEVQGDERVPLRAGHQRVGEVQIGFRHHQVVEALHQAGG